MFSELKKSKN